MRVPLVFLHFLKVTQMHISDFEIELGSEF